MHFSSSSSFPFKRLLSSFSLSKTLSTTATAAVPQRHHDQQQRGKRVIQSAVLNPVKEALTDYLYSTRSLLYPYAENISNNSPSFLRSLLPSKKPPAGAGGVFAEIKRFLRYSPINEYHPFLESIGIPVSEIPGFLPARRLFLSENQTLLNCLGILSEYGFPWNKLGVLYRHEASIFENSRLRDRLEGIAELGFSRTHLIAVCLTFPSVLSRFDDEERLLDDLKWVLSASSLANSHSVDLCYKNCRKLEAFYGLGCEKGKVKDVLVGGNLEIFIAACEENVVEKIGFFSRLGMNNVDIGWFVLRHPEILNFDLRDTVITIPEYLYYIGLDRETVDSILRVLPHVLGRNRLRYLPEILKSLDLQSWLIDKILNGGDRFLAVLNSASAIEDSKNSEISVENKLLDPKREFLQSIGFGQNRITEKLIYQINSSKEQFQQRFDRFLQLGLDFSAVSKMVAARPKILNQNASMIQAKIVFFRDELQLPLEDLQKFPAYMLFDLEGRVKPRHKFITWLRERHLVQIKYAPATIVAASGKLFIRILGKIHPAAPKQWLELFSFKTS